MFNNHIITLFKFG